MKTSDVEPETLKDFSNPKLNNHNDASFIVECVIAN